MINYRYKFPKSYNFSLAFEKMCSFAAIANTRNTNEALKQLILQCFVVFPNERFENAQQLMDTIEVLSGIRISEHQIQDILNQLIKEGLVQEHAANNLVLPSHLLKDLQKRIDAASALENLVKQEWLEEVSIRFPNLPSTELWAALRHYLADAFLRHGIHTMMLLDPTVEPPPNHLESLSSLLDAALQDFFTLELQSTAKKAISSFLSEVGAHAERATYITQLADGAFNYFSLTVDPEVAKQFRQRLISLVLFLDTNFLFGILDVHDSPFVQVSHELLDATEKNNLPFKLRYHETTEKEMRMTIDYYGRILGSQQWTRNMSRLTCTEHSVSGIQYKYHQLNAQEGIDVSSFLKRYTHLDVLLRGKNISIYKDMLQAQRQQERNNLHNEYQEFLNKIKKPKPYETIKHDTILLDTIDLLRTKTKSSLEMGALFITCDYSLYNFDCQRNRSKGTIPCVVLPNVFWQILRPFVSSDENFNRSFAATFAIPEFRTIRSGSSRACAKLRSLLTTYRNLPEETAAKMISNDLLIENLRDVKDEEQFKEYIESAIASENESLMEERAALEKELEREKAEKEATAKKLANEKATIERESQMKREELEEKLAKEKEHNKHNAEQAERERQAREDAESKARQEALLREEETRRAATYAKKTSVLLSIMLSMILIGAFEFPIYLIPWDWLIHSINSYLIQGTFDFLLVTISFGVFNKKRRAWYWTVAALSILLVLLQILAVH